MKFKFATVLALSFVLFIPLRSTAQSYKKLLKKADSYYYDENFEEAYNAYSNLDRQFPGETLHNYQMQIAYHLTKGRGSDISQLLAFEKRRNEIDEFHNYFLGRIYILRYDFDMAIRRFGAFLNTDFYKSKQIIAETENYLSWAKEAKQFYEAIDEYEIYPLPNSINTAFSEVAPVFFNGHDELIYFRSTDMTSDFFNAFHALKKDDKWSENSKINVFGEFNKFETRAEVLANDDKVLLYKQENGGDLFTSRFEQSAGWTAPIEYDESLRMRISSDFFINNDENLILYSSNDGGQYDIFQIKKVGDEWQYPELLQFSTAEFDEDFPFMTDEEDIIYFSSNRPESIGGYDVFKVIKDNESGDWSEPINLGFPINTIDNEFQFQINHGTNTGYFSSNRLHGQGLYDIYYFFEVEKQKIKGKITNLDNNEPLPNITLKFHPIKYTDESIVGETDEYGNFIIDLITNENFKVDFYAGDALVDTKEVSINEERTTQNFKLSIPEDLVTHENYENLYESKGEKVIPIQMLGNKFRTGKKTIIQNIYFDFQSDHLRDDSKPVLETLQKTLKKYPDTKIQIAGFTDNIGSQQYNISLSLKRANSVKNYLVKNGIASSRLETKGFGELNPLASNDDEKDGRELNRRIEITLIE